MLRQFAIIKPWLMSKFLKLIVSILFKNCLQLKRKKQRSKFGGLNISQLVFCRDCSSLSTYNAQMLCGMETDTIWKDHSNINA